MKKILLAIFLSCVLLSYTFGENLIENNTNIRTENSLFNLVQGYVELNTKMKEYKQVSDTNSSTYKQIIDELNQEKQKILSRIPEIIVSQEVEQKDVDKFLQKKESLKKIKNSSQKQSFTYINADLDLLYLQVLEEFYNTLTKLKELFKNAAGSEDMIKLIDESMKNLQALVNIDLTSYKNKITNTAELETINTKEALIKETFTSYSEILKYLRTNARLLESNYLFSALGLQVWIDKVNSLVNIEFLNVGKITISLLVLVFFMSLRKFFSHIVYFFLVKLVYRGKANADEIKTMFIENIKKPVGFLLVIYAISLCLTIAFYPAPMNLGLSNTFYIIYAIFIAWLVLAVLDGYGVVLVSKLAQKSGKKEVVNLIIKILYFVIIVIAFLFILAQLGFNISAIIASLGIGGLAVALAAKDIIANFFASILLLFDNSFNQGDWVEVSGVEGTVVETGLRKTTIRTFDNSLVFLPNSVIMGANIKNWSKRRIGRQVKMYLGVGYDASPEKLEACVKDLKELLHTSPLVAHADDSALKYGDSSAKYRQNLVSINDLEGYKNDCYVGLSDFGESSINIEIYFYTKAVTAEGFRNARQALMLEFMRIVEKHGLSFAFPSRSIYIENLPPLDGIVKK
ncbi:mechanosensitive ion channel family protein [Campylobacter helveticus]|uniref:mechanosensitive ion channel family protein n=1 Tax=Campylobacter helveticus TaxID=28898 RepID=UPI0022EA267C|nr:mechanosensitive ion channel domain-containing protein [Campylobacter helveticus]